MTRQLNIKIQKTDIFFPPSKGVYSPTYNTAISRKKLRAFVYVCLQKLILKIRT